MVMIAMAVMWRCRQSKKRGCRSSPRGGQGNESPIEDDGRIELTRSKIEKILLQDLYHHLPHNARPAWQGQFARLDG
jgi:hypothetical protein